MFPWLLLSASVFIPLLYTAEFYLSCVFTSEFFFFFFLFHGNKQNKQRERKKLQENISDAYLFNGADVYDSPLS
jgi:hypothetical protein